MRQAVLSILLLFIVGGCASDPTPSNSQDGPPVDYLEQPNSGSECTNDDECDDGNPCTEDVCRGTEGCGYVALVATCDDGDPCTVGELCGAGECGGGVDACACRTDQDCASLDDGNLCNGVLICNTTEAPYACELDVTSVVMCEGEPGICKDLVCDPKSGVCGETSSPEGIACDDGDACTEGDACAGGQCIPGIPAGCIGRECGESADGCSCGTCEVGALCTANGLCLESGVACGDVPPNGTCQDGGLLSCENGELVVQPCTGCCTWDADLEAPVCAEGDACETCIDECDADTTGCNTLGTHGWTCEPSADEDSCLVRVFTLCEQGPCSFAVGGCIDASQDGDEDGVPDAVDNCAADANPGQTDGDDDGLGDACDDDDDGDGILDADDNCPGQVAEDTTDTDEDGVGDFCDTDDDGDGVLDDLDNCPLTSNIGQIDTDADEVGDVCDDDDDGDGVLDGEDVFPLDANEQVDGDGDGLGDNGDNCPMDSNAAQTDTDDDGEGDVCDADDDGDGVLDIDDNCPKLVSEDTTDTDSDGLGDLCDADDDGDGVLDIVDNCVTIPNVGQPDGDKDGVGDACDPDVIACFSPGIEKVEPTSLPATIALGGFQVVATSDSLVVRHSDEPERDLFAPPSGGTWLHLAKSHLHAEEHQGSFKLEEEIFTRCEEPVIDKVYTQDGSLLLVGGFADDAPECAEATWKTRMCQAGDHRLTFNITSEDPYFDLVVLRAHSDAEENIWGAGEQFPHETLNLKGRTLPILAQEGGLGRGHAVITPAVNKFSEGSGGTEDSTYVASAHYLTSEARSLFLENTETAFFDFSPTDAIELRLYASEMAAQVVHGSEPLELIERFTDWTGRMVAPPAWANQGAIVALARPLEESLAHVDNLLNDGAALAAVWNQTWSGTATTYIGEQVLWNWVLNEKAHPGWHDWVGELDKRGLRVLCYVNTMFRELPEDVKPVKRDLYQEGMEGGYFVNNEEGMVLKLPVTAFDVALLDFTNEAARTWMKDIIKEEMIDYAGCSGWMADFAEALPFEAVMSDGTEGDVWHNRYPVEWAALNREALKEAGKLDDVLVFNRSGHTKTPGAALAMWQGDQLVTWDKYDGLVSAIHGLISGGFSGFSINHSDIGGYTSMAWLNLGYTREKGLLKRWTEMAAFTSLMRTHEGNQPPKNAQVYSDQDTREHFGKMTRVYRALAFYRDQLFAEATSKGWPVVRHLLMHWPKEKALYEVSDQFLLGSEILVAPIKNKCFTWPSCPYNKKVTLPPGQWVHLWSGEVFGDAQAVSEITVKAPFGKPAVFYPVGSEVGETFVTNLKAEGIEVTQP